MDIPDEIDKKIYEENIGHWLAVKVDPKNYQHFKVPGPVYNYTKQLEMAIKYRDFNGITRLYPERFTKIKTHAETFGNPPNWYGYL